MWFTSFPSNVTNYQFNRTSSNFSSQLPSIVVDTSRPALYAASSERDLRCGYPEHQKRDARETTTLNPDWRCYYVLRTRKSP